jgi:CTP synthase
VTPDPVIDLKFDQHDVADMGGSMRLGTYPCKVAADTKGFEIYGEELIYERHRHRFEVNNAYRDRLAEAGLVISGLSPDGRLVEMVELADHPFFVGHQGHPEFKSRPNRPAPLFREFVGAAVRLAAQRAGEPVAMPPAAVPAQSQA